jgi:histone H3/H4
MANISKDVLKDIIAKNSSLILEEKAMDAILEILQNKAVEIAAFAVGAAERKKRSTVLKEDIEEYILTSGE